METSQLSIPGLQNKILVLRDENTIKAFYLSEEFEIITQEMLLEISNTFRYLEVILITNAGIDIHITQYKIYNIMIQKASYASVKDYIKTILNITI